MDQDPGHYVAQGNEFTIGRSLTILLSHTQSQQLSGILMIICSWDARHLNGQPNCVRVSLYICSVNSSWWRLVKAETLTIKHHLTSAVTIIERTWSGHLKINEVLNTTNTSKALIIHGFLVSAVSQQPVTLSVFARNCNPSSEGAYLWPIGGHTLRDYSM